MAAVALRETLPPGPRGLPRIGHLLTFQRDPLAFVRGVQRAYPRLATVRVADRTIVMFFRPEHARFFLVDQARSFAVATGREMMRRFLGDALLTTDGELHRQQRRLVQPAFHKKRVESYADIMVRQTLDMLDTWQPGERLDVAAALQEVTLRIVVQALFNVDLRTQSAGLSHLFTQVVEAQNPVLLRYSTTDLPFLPYHKVVLARRQLDAFIYELIAERRKAERDEGDVLSMLLRTRDEENGLMLDDVGIRDQMMTLIAAGHETTSNSLAWTLVLLSRHPEIRDRLLRELSDELGGRPPSVDDLPRLPYLDWVVNESMRVYPPAWTLGRSAIEPFELEGYRFPAGTRVMFSQWVIHHLTDIWGDPDTFRPERWDPVTGQKPPAGAYFPFGAGPRMCIGMPFAQIEARLVLATILQRFTPELLPGQRVEPLPRVTLRVKNGLPMTLQPTAAPVAVTR